MRHLFSPPWGNVKAHSVGARLDVYLVSFGEGETLALTLDVTHKQFRHDRGQCTSRTQDPALVCRDHSQML